jgi:hypothetical protein
MPLFGRRQEPQDYWLEELKPQDFNDVAQAIQVSQVGMMEYVYQKYRGLFPQADDEQVRAFIGAYITSLYGMPQDEEKFAGATDPFNEQGQLITANLLRDKWFRSVLAEPLRQNVRYLYVINSPAFEVAQMSVDRIFQLFGVEAKKKLQNAVQFRFSSQMIYQMARRT